MTIETYLNLPFPKSETETKIFLQNCLADLYLESLEAPDAKLSMVLEKEKEGTFLLDLNEVPPYEVWQAFEGLYKQLKGLLRKLKKDPSGACLSEEERQFYHSFFYSLDSYGDDHLDYWLLCHGYLDYLYEVTTDDVVSESESLVWAFMDRRTELACKKQLGDGPIARYFADAVAAWLYEELYREKIVDTQASFLQGGHRQMTEKNVTTQATKNSRQNRLEALIRLFLSFVLHSYATELIEH